MDILLIGGAGNITNAILEKLHKEGHRIYVLTGTELKLHTYRHVFEQYSFSYESTSIREIFESVSPDVTIFMGAFDTNFNWEHAREEAVRFSAGLLNILMGYSLVKCGRFLYLSSDEVYSRSYLEDIPESEPANARDFRGMAFAQGEELCRKYQQFEELDLVIVRLDHLCAVPNRREEAKDVCSRMCVQALKTGVIEASERNCFSLLYCSDAVQFLYELVVAKSHKQPLYHISSSMELSEMELAKLVQKELGQSVSIRDNTVGEPYRSVLCGQSFQEEFQAKIFYPPERAVSQIASYIRSHRRQFLEEGDRGSGLPGRFFQSSRTMIRALIPFVENLIVFIPAFMLNNRATDSAYFSKLDFYLLYVLLFAIVYGQQQATVSAILATAGYCFRQMYTRSGFEVLMDYNTYVWIAQLFILGLVIGYLHDQLAVIRREGKDEAEYLSGQIEDIQVINTSNVRIKGVYEEQIINHSQSIGKIYEITSELDQYAPEEVLFYAAEIIARLFGSRDVAIYSVANTDYARLFSSTSERARSLGNSIRYSDMGELYQNIMEKKVFINKNMIPEYPMLASGIFEEERLQLIIMVWGIPWERMNLSLANMLTVTGYLIQNAVLRANRYQKALERERYREGTKILEKKAFTSLVKAYLTAQNKGLTECALLRIEVGPEALHEAAEQAAQLLRTTDYMGELKEDGLYVLLSNTNRDGAQIVAKRFRDIGYDAVYQEELEI